jgi:hypothetical protein
MTNNLPSISSRFKACQAPFDRMAGTFFERDKRLDMRRAGRTRAEENQVIAPICHGTNSFCP